MEIRPLSPALGAEILGVDIASGLSNAEHDAIVRAYGDYGVIFFRDQRLTPEQHIALARRFGEINVNRFFRPVDDYPLIAEVRKEPDQSSNIGGGWHTDHSYDTAPAMGSILSELLRQDRLVAIDSFGVDAPKTKELAGKLAGLGLGNVLIVSDNPDDNLYLSARNLPGVAVCDAEGAECRDQAAEPHFAAAWHDAVTEHRHDQRTHPQGFAPGEDALKGFQQGGAWHARFRALGHGYWNTARHQMIHKKLIIRKLCVTFRQPGYGRQCRE